MTSDFFPRYSLLTPPFALPLLLSLVMSMEFRIPKVSGRQAGRTQAYMVHRLTNVKRFVLQSSWLDNKGTSKIWPVTKTSWKWPTTPSRSIACATTSPDRKDGRSCQPHEINIDEPAWTGIPRTRECSFN